MWPYLHSAFAHPARLLSRRLSLYCRESLFRVRDVMTGMPDDLHVVGIWLYHPAGSLLADTVHSAVLGRHLIDGP